MNQKGVAAAAAVVVVIIIAVVGVSAFLLLRGGGALGQLPVYSGAQEVPGVDVMQIMTQYGVPSNWSGKAYTTTASPETVIGWYRTQMTGWEKIADNTIPYEGYTIYALAYQKGNDAAVISTYTQPGVGNLLILLAGPKGS